MTAGVVGVDLSLVSTGMARIRPDGTANTWTIKASGKREATVSDRCLRIKLIAAAVGAAILDGEEVIIESPAHSQGAESGTWDRAGLWWFVVGDLQARGVPTHHIAPGTAKKWITGSGNAGKNTVGVFVGRLFPDVEISNDDEADALAYAHVAAVRAGFPVATRAGHVPANWKAVKWAYELGGGAG